MKIYLVTTGEYDDYEVAYVCTDEEIARATANALNEVSEYSCATVEEMDITDKAPEVTTYWTAYGGWNGLYQEARVARPQQNRVVFAPEYGVFTDTALVKGKHLYGTFTKVADRNPDGSWVKYPSVSVHVTARSSEEALKLCRDTLDLLIDKAREEFR
jgi:hypothetical protein